MALKASWQIAPQRGASSALPRRSATCIDTPPPSVALRSARGHQIDPRASRAGAAEPRVPQAQHLDLGHRLEHLEAGPLDGPPRRHVAGEHEDEGPVLAAGVGELLK